MNVDFFHNQVLGALAFFSRSHFAEKAFHTGMEFVDKDGEPVALDPETREIIAEADRSFAEVIRFEHNIARATYIVGWSALETLLSECVADLCRSAPRRLAGRQKEAISQLVRVASGEITREQLLDELVASEVETFGTKSLFKQREYLQNTWSVQWPDEFFQQLNAIGDRRNSAAHDPSFRTPGREQVYADLADLLSLGPQVAKAVTQAIELQGRPRPSGI